MAPEVVRHERAGRPADVFSYGILLWCLCAGSKYPYEKDYLLPEQAAEGVANGVLRPRRLQRLDSFPKLQALIERCWAQEPGMRPAMPEVVDELLAIRQKMRESPKVKERPQSGGAWASWLFGLSMRQ